VTKFLRLSPRGPFSRIPLRRREDTQGVVVSACTFGSDFHYQCPPLLPLAISCPASDSVRLEHGDVPVMLAGQRNVWRRGSQLRPHHGRLPPHQEPRSDGRDSFWMDAVCSSIPLRSGRWAASSLAAAFMQRHSQASSSISFLSLVPNSNKSCQQFTLPCIDSCNRVQFSTICELIPGSIPLDLPSVPLENSLLLEQRHLQDNCLGPWRRPCSGSCCGPVRAWQSLPASVPARVAELPRDGLRAVVLARARLRTLWSLSATALARGGAFSR
jgi:hypothetical protein